jgi:head-tail adaptor
VATSIGKLKDRVRFEPRILDSNGDPTGAFTLEGSLTVPALVVAKLGQEVVVGQRLVGLQPVGVTIHRTRNSRQITTAWRMIWEGQVFNIKTAVRSEDRAFINILAVADQTNGG